MSVVRRKAASDRIHSLEEALAEALAVTRERFSYEATGEAARSFVIALETRDAWWVGFGQRCLDSADPDVKRRGNALGEVVFARITQSPL